MRHSSMLGSDYGLSDRHLIGLSDTGWVTLSSLDPNLADMEQLKLNSIGWWLPQPASGTSAQTKFIDPTASTEGDGSLGHPFKSWSDVTWSAGTTYLQKAGTVSSGPIIVTGSGTNTSPIIIGSYGTGPAAAVHGSVVFDNVHYVAMTGLAVSNTPHSAVIIENGSSHIEVAGNTLSNSGMGVNVTSNAGGSNLIEGNDIHDNSVFGIGLTANNRQNDETIIAGNSIRDNGSHGIELHGNRYIVENNFVSGNGGAFSGSSGIHTFAFSPAEDAGNHNTIRYNTAVENHDSMGQDGNGIELDQFTSDNQVYSNLTFGNDGAGIVLFDSFHNIVQNNTLVADQRDSGGTHMLQGELLLAGEFGMTSGNTIANNTAIVNSPTALASLTNADTSPNPQTFTNNDFINWTGTDGLSNPTAADASLMTDAAAVVNESYYVGAQTAFATLPHDFNNDGKSDLLIQNTSGAVVAGEVVNGQASYSQVATLGPEWKFEGSGDFLGDGMQGFLIGKSNGAVVVGEVAGGHASYTQVGALGPEWSFEATGEFLGDGKFDFLIQNTRGAVVAGEVVNGQASYTQVAGLGPEWKFEGAGDFLGKGHDQFLIENSSGSVVLGEIVGGQTNYTQVAALGQEWKFEGTGDFLGDGKFDFLIQNTNGAVVAGEVVNGQSTYIQLAALGPEWKFEGTGDYLGEGHDQFLIQNSNGAVAIGDYLNGQIHYIQVAALGSEWSFH